MRLIINCIAKQMTSMFLFIGVILYCMKCTSPDMYTTDATVIAKGETLFQNNCSACHNFKKSVIGPSLGGLTATMPAAWIRQFILNPQKMIESKEERAVQLFEKYKLYMPSFEGILQPEDIEAILAYMNTFPSVSVLATNPALGDTLSDPIPTKIPMSDITLRLEYVATAPPTADKPPVARINKMRVMPGKSKRLFLQELRGTLYELKQGTLIPYLTIRDYQQHFIDQPGHGTGFGSLAFHPDFERNGLFYTTHTEDPKTSPPADFHFEPTIPVKVRWVLTEWKLLDPNAKTFQGTHRELMRVDMVTQIHGVQEIAFNPLAQPNDADYGMLYVGIGDGGSVGEGITHLVQSKNTIWGTIIRIDPRGNNSKNGKYGVPKDNPFAGDSAPNVVKEVWARGFRNPNRFVWDTKGDGKMLATDIGQHGIEELNQVLPGQNYGWAEREGTFIIDKQGDLHHLYERSTDDNLQEFTYPVLQYDHDEGNAISCGYVYYGKNMPALYGKYIFGDIVNGRVFYATAKELELGKQATIQEIKLEDTEGKEIILTKLTNYNKVDLRFGLDGDGEMYLFTKTDGKIYQIQAARNNNTQQ